MLGGADAIKPPNVAIPISGQHVKFRSSTVLLS